MTRRNARILRIVATLTCLAAVPAAAFAECCIVQDNGFGTATLPPLTTGATCLYLGTMEISDGLPVGSTIQISASIGYFFNVIESPGGALGGTESTWDGLCSMQMTGTGALLGFNRSLSFPLNGFPNNVFAWAPRTPFAPVQTAAAQVYQLFGQMVGVGDPDFDLLRVTGGNNFGLPSPGQIQLVSTGGGWAVSGYFDLTHRIDFVGSPGGALAGMSGSTTRQRRFEICPENAVAVEGASWSHLKALYR
ncbi:MAG: hypothetical protein IPI48_03350 [bacterium]|nr:hypothetical protein [bacterium]